MIQSIRKIEAEKEEKTQAANKANANLMQMVEEVKLKRNLIGELKKENIEFESKLKQQQKVRENIFTGGAISQMKETGSGDGDFLSIFYSF